MSSDGVQDPPRLVCDLSYWEVHLVDGATLHIRAHAYSEQDGCSVFVALIKGSPPIECELVRIPSQIVREVEGGWTKSRE
jgi:hypothetical protein